MASTPATDVPPGEACDLTATIRRYGGDWQPLLRAFSDAVAALELPDTAWAVLSCPVDGMDLESEFVALIDRDGDGRVRADDVREAVRWTASMLVGWDGVTEGSAPIRGSPWPTYATLTRFVSAGTGMATGWFL